LSKTEYISVRSAVSLALNSSVNPEFVSVLHENTEVVAELLALQLRTAIIPGWNLGGDRLS
jgi:hypothetical protein